MKYSYRPQGVCSTNIEFEIEDGVIREISFTGGCNGNLKAVATLAKGMKAEDVVEKLAGMRCGLKKTSCPDQLSRALKQALGEG